MESTQPSVCIRFADIPSVDITDRVCALRIRSRVHWSGTPAKRPDRIVFQFTQCGATAGAGLPVEPLQCTAHLDSDPAILDATLFMRASNGATIVHTLVQWEDPWDGTVGARAALSVPFSYLCTPGARVRLGDCGVSLECVAPPVHGVLQVDTLQDLVERIPPSVGTRVVLEGAAAEAAMRTNVACLDACAARTCAGYHAPTASSHERYAPTAGSDAVPDAPPDRTAAPEVAAQLGITLARLARPMIEPDSPDDVALCEWLLCMARCFVAGVRTDGLASALVPWTAVANGRGGERVRVHTPAAHVARMRALWRATPAAAAYALVDAVYALPAARTPEERPALVAIPCAWADPKAGGAGAHNPTLAFLFVPGVWRWPVVLSGAAAEHVARRCTESPHNELAIWSSTTLVGLRRSQASPGAAEPSGATSTAQLVEALAARAIDLGMRLAAAGSTATAEPNILTHTVRLEAPCQFSDVVARA